MDYKEILEIQNPLILFNQNWREQYKQLMILFHPDKHKEDTETYNKITMHINELLVKFKSINVDKKDLLYINNRNVDTEYIYNNKVVYSLPYRKDFIQKVHKIIFQYHNEDMEKEFTKIIPKFVFENDNIIVNKGEHFYPLELVMKKAKKLDIKTVAWIISRLLNICCFLEYNNIAYNNFQISNLFIHPIRHMIAIYGGWYYTEILGNKLSILDSNIYNIIPNKIKENKICTIETDIFCVKNIAKKLLGNEMNMLRNKNIPSAFSEWLFNNKEKSAFIAFENYDKLLVDTFGGRKYTPFPIEIDNRIYY